MEQRIGNKRNMLEVFVPEIEGKRSLVRTLAWKETQY
jgi:hypothetical protein